MAKRQVGGGRSVDGHLVQRIAPWGSTNGAVHPNIAADARQAGQVVGAAGASRGAVNRGPVRRIVGDLNLVRLTIRRLPVQDDLIDVVLSPEVNVDPLRIAVCARPSRRQTTVHGSGRWI